MIKIKPTLYLRQKKAKLEAGITALQIAKLTVSSLPIIDDLSKAEGHLHSLVGELRYQITKRELVAQKIGESNVYPSQN